MRLPPDTGPPRTPYRPGESPLQCAIRDDFERLENQLKGLPESVDLIRCLGLLTRACECAVVAAARVQ